MTQVFTQVLVTLLNPIMGLPTVVLWMIALLATLFWILQLSRLMSLAEHQFPSRFDKYIWIGLLLLVNLPAAAAFWVWNRHRVAMPVRRLSSRLAEGGLDARNMPQEPSPGN